MYLNRIGSFCINSSKRLNFSTGTITSSTTTSATTSSGSPFFIIPPSSSSTSSTSSTSSPPSEFRKITNPLKSRLNASTIVMQPTTSLIFPMLFKHLSPQLERVGNPYKILDLTADEKYYFNLFRDVLIYFKRQDVQLRVAGGWVRNKLLGIQGGTDIDIAIDNLTGHEFVQMIQKYYSINNQILFRNYIIKSNPEKSKHLETASLVMKDGLTFDFTGLRSEEYDEFSRIPNIVKGTLISDSHRRDITINSLYYNLMTTRVEDYTLMGLPDLENKIVRTPLSPTLTLCEDPLRALRVLRFSNRFSFSIESQLYESLCSDRVRDLLGLKVSRERVHTEFTSMMMSYKHAIPYFKTLVDTGLIHSIFPTQGLITTQDWYQSLHYLEQSQHVSNIVPDQSIQEFILSSIFLPLKLKYQNHLDVFKILLDLKYSKKICFNVSSTLLSYEILKDPIQLITSRPLEHLIDDNQLFEGSVLPLLKWLRHNQLWKNSLWTARLYFYVNHHPVLSRDDQIWIDAQQIIEKEIMPISNTKFCFEARAVMDALGIVNSCDIRPAIDQIMVYQWKNKSTSFSLDHIVKNQFFKIT
ncbi:tRNA ADENILYL transferase [Cavenderia fasciculata]|uniref:tRNA ADENILYL transferase n=1 Tax=Cavenderia fasciculata TaxID=261658 RepID=F4PS67_CACFS|nr:tRNA ADENILYL transferase [Cavenderia fasciculata]EGG21450.1 tRNA ADENILYL transferase [Cavenderia fasciculata]|eukprot:XP_004359300.1 tRNA ADENILYL transferase [Cavenderia fasciculata]